jgi:AraC-like DNA-binding protein
MTDSTPHVRTLFRSRLIHVFDYRCPGHDDKGEIPQGFEIVLPRAGAYQRRDAHGTFLADPNQVLFYNKDEPYDISHPVQGGDVSTVFLFAPSLLIEMIRAYNPSVENQPRRLFQRSHITLHARLQILQYHILRAGRTHIEPLGMEEQIITALSEVIHGLYQGRYPRLRHSSKTQRVHSEQTDAIKTYLNAHVRSNLQLEQISSAVHLSPFHLCRVFKQNTGLTLHQYVRRLRLFNTAEHILENPKTRLDLLAFDYGFSNHGNFSTAFRATFGLNPSELRSSHLRETSKILKA